MARYISQHTLACLTRQGAEELAKRLAAATAVTAKRVLVNMQEGKMMVEFDAAVARSWRNGSRRRNFISIGYCAWSLSLPRARCVRWFEKWLRFWFVSPPFTVD